MQFLIKYLKLFLLFVFIGKSFGNPVGNTCPASSEGFCLSMTQDDECCFDNFYKCCKFYSFKSPDFYKCIKDCDDDEQVTDYPDNSHDYHEYKGPTVYTKPSYGHTGYSEYNNRMENVYCKDECCRYYFKSCAHKFALGYKYFRNCIDTSCKHGLPPQQKYQETHQAFPVICNH
ncbi:uncharacterized protein LOC129802319 isoform X2 [Phlebotomus papatasi]|uniref:uncharacterized protein LOC129802319 isoform X2 n=1 Tax=Phlebotomus papatasi TaxID=29031 RepID=UPI0024843411|nr:uncharacterized protein LOC129802319 isoform X2 [Phlebotomus papatasi]